MEPAASRRGETRRRRGAARTRAGRTPSPRCARDVETVVFLRVRARWGEGPRPWDRTRTRRRAARRDATRAASESRREAPPRARRPRHRSGAGNTKRVVSVVSAAGFPARRSNARRRTRGTSPASPGSARGAAAAGGRGARRILKDAFPLGGAARPRRAPTRAPEESRNPFRFQALWLFGFGLRRRRRRRRRRLRGDFAASASSRARSIPRRIRLNSSSRAAGRFRLREAPPASGSARARGRAKLDEGSALGDGRPALAFQDSRASSAPRRDAAAADGGFRLRLLGAGSPPTRPRRACASAAERRGTPGGAARLLGGLELRALDVRLGGVERNGRSPPPRSPPRLGCCREAPPRARRAPPPPPSTPSPPRVFGGPTASGGVGFLRSRMARGCASRPAQP